MKARQLTPWYPANIKPQRKGWYEAKCSDGSIDKKNWWFDGNDWRDAPSSWTCSFQDRPWRGLTYNPSKARDEQ